MKHTTEKWNIEETFTRGQRTGLSVHPCHFYFQGMVDETVRANARLIAAAPELLEACHAALEIIDCYTLGSAEEIEKKPIAKMLRAAIAKVEGKQEKK